MGERRAGGLKLKTATSIAIIGSVLMLISCLYTYLMNQDVIELTAENYKTHSTIVSVLQFLSALTFVNFFVSFMNAQRKRG